MNIGRNLHLKAGAKEEEGVVRAKCIPRRVKTAAQSSSKKECKGEVSRISINTQDAATKTETHH